MQRIFLAVAGVLGICRTAPAAPLPHWSSGAKSGIGTAYQAEGTARSTSRVWFSLAHGQLTEIAYGLIHENQVRGVRVEVDDAGPAAEATQAYIDTDVVGRPLAPAFRLRQDARDGRYSIEQQVLADPAADTVLLRIVVTARGARR